MTCSAEVVDDDRPFPVGYPQFPVTHLPARDGIAHGGIERSARAPNCSYFTNWTKTSDYITWDIEVATSGTYEATVHYTCPAKDVGSTIELSFGDTKIESQVSEAFDPPLVGTEHDRAPRKSESLVKEFRPLLLGRMELTKGSRRTESSSEGDRRHRSDGCAICRADVASAVKIRGNTGGRGVARCRWPYGN